MSTTITLNRPSPLFGKLFNQLGLCRDAAARKTSWLGPAFIASIAYVDPGNFAANLAGGAQCGYSLLWVLLWGNIIALLVQTLSCRLGIFTGESLAKNCGMRFPLVIKFALWVVAELMSIATELAEVLGAGIGITLVFHTDLFASCVLAGLLSFAPFVWKGKEQRFIEKLMVLAIIAIGMAFAYELIVTRPNWLMATRGTVIPELHANNVLVAASMLGATVMPHVVFLHSGLMKNHLRHLDPDRRYKLAIADNFVALNFAWLINAAMVVTFAAAYSGMPGMAPTIQSVSRLLCPLFGNFSALVFGLALIIAGLGSTTVGSMAGQVILDGFFNIKISILARRVITLIPCLFVIHTGCDTTKLLVLSQAALSLALPFTIIPLICLNASKSTMGEKRLKGAVLVCSLAASALVIALNVALLFNLKLSV